MTAEAGLSGRPPRFPLSKRWPPVFCLLSSRSLLRRGKLTPDSAPRRGYELMLQHDSEAEIETLSRFRQVDAPSLRRAALLPKGAPSKQKLQPSHLGHSGDDKVRHAPRQRRGYLDSVYLSALARVLIFLGAGLHGGERLCGREQLITFQAALPGWLLTRQSGLDA